VKSASVRPIDVTASLISPHWKYGPGEADVTVEQGLETTPGLGGVVLTQFDVSDTGTLAYVPAAAHEPPDQLFWVDQRGNQTLITEGRVSWVHPRLSPDGSRFSVRGRLGKPHSRETS
jgi:hypothetical protein